MKIESLDKSNEVNYAGIPVLRFSIQLPEIKESGRAAKRINKFYSSIYEREIEFAVSKLGLSASSEFDYCMSQSKFFEPFSFQSRFQSELSETNTLTIKRFITINLGKSCTIKKEFTDIWELKYGTPLKNTSLVKSA